MVPSVSVVPTPAKCLSVESPTGVPPWGGRPQTFSRSYFCSEGFPSRASSPRHSKPVEWRSRRRLFFLRGVAPLAVSVAGWRPCSGVMASVSALTRRAAFV